MLFSSYVHRLWIFDVDDRKALRLLGGEEAELDFLDGARGSARVGEMHVRHDCGRYFDPGDDAKGLFGDGRSSTVERDDGQSRPPPSWACPKASKVSRVASCRDFDPKNSWKYFTRRLDVRKEGARCRIDEAKGVVGWMRMARWM
jgi:hypothetical protein